MAMMSPAQPLSMKTAKYALALSWDKSGNGIDVDLQAIIVDNRGTIIDAVYYNNLTAWKVVTHSGDQRTGDKGGYDEVIWADLASLPENVQMIIFVAATHSGGHLRDVKNGMFHLLQFRTDNCKGKFRMERSVEEVDMVAAFVKSGSSWECQVLEEPAQDGQHFMDILEPSIGSFVRKIIPGAPRRQKVAFAMQKGAVAALPKTDKLGTVKAGLGWDASSAGQDVDLDVSAVFFNSGGVNTGQVFFGNQQEYGFKHSGDNLTGEGSGDDEAIMCNLSSVPSSIAQIFFVVNIYNKGVTFNQVKNAYCRIVDGDGSEMARYRLTDASNHSGLAIARFFRINASRWGFEALGEFVYGNTYADSVPDLRVLFQVSPGGKQAAPPAPAAAPPAPAPPAAAPSPGVSSPMPLMGVPGKYEVTILGAMDLPNTDGGMGKSDPYCKVSMGGAVLFSTGSQTNNLNPTWGTKKAINWDGMNDIIFTIMDKDLFTRDDFMAQYVLPKEKVPQGISGSFTLEVPPQHRTPGMKEPQITLMVSPAGEAGCCAGCSIQ
mmetsp:Transcript_45143/g.84475  ORF Transcript_45143/g.84475 Transcript_45143/m.84475 type:complete len:546 (+) Transcript_45143:120-1757(+)